MKFWGNLQRNQYTFATSLTSWCKPHFRHSYTGGKIMVETSTFLHISHTPNLALTVLKNITSLSIALTGVLLTLYLLWFSCKRVESNHSLIPWVVWQLLCVQVLCVKFCKVSFLCPTRWPRCSYLAVLFFILECFVILTISTDLNHCPHEASLQNQGSFPLKVGFGMFSRDRQIPGVTWTVVKTSVASGTVEAGSRHSKCT
jgi:uncharacterized membrane protein YjfL (UPF0719 family)